MKTDFSDEVDRLCRDLKASEGLDLIEFIERTRQLPWQKRSAEEVQSWRLRERKGNLNFKKAADEVLPLSKFLRLLAPVGGTVHMAMDSMSDEDALVVFPSGQKISVEITAADDSGSRRWDAISLNSLSPGEVLHGFVRDVETKPHPKRLGRLLETPVRHEGTYSSSDWLELFEAEVIEAYNRKEKRVLGEALDCDHHILLICARGGDTIPVENYSTCLDQLRNHAANSRFDGIYLLVEGTEPIVFGLKQVEFEFE